MGFYREESCGKCTPCREGGGWIEKILERIERGQGQISDLDLIERLTWPIERQSFCPFGAASVWGVRSMLKLFRPDFEAYIQQTNPTGKAPGCRCGPFTGRIRVSWRRRSGCSGRTVRSW